MENSRRYEVKDSMTIAQSIRATVRNEIDKYGSTAYLYLFSSATTKTNEEGDITVSSWGTPTTIKVVSSDHQSFLRLMSKMGIENNQRGRGFLVKDNVTITEKDKIIVDSVAYEVTGIKKIDPIQNTNIAYKINVDKNEQYT